MMCMSYAFAVWLEHWNETHCCTLAPVLLEVPFSATLPALFSLSGFHVDNSDSLRCQ